jgi:hypothetical protein
MSNATSSSSNPTSSIVSPPVSVHVDVQSAASGSDFSHAVTTPPLLAPSMCNIFLEELTDEEGDRLPFTQACPVCTVVVGRHNRRPQVIMPAVQAAEAQHAASPRSASPGHHEEKEEKTMDRAKATIEIMKLLKKDVLPKWNSSSTVPYVYLQTIERNMSLTRIPTEHWNIVLLLTHPMESTSSCEWIKTELIDKQVPWAKSKELFTAHFQSADYMLTLENKLDRCRQGKTQSVQAYSDYFKNLITQLNVPCDDRTTIRKFLKGLTPDMYKRFLSDWKIHAKTNNIPITEFPSLYDVIQVCIEADVEERNLQLQLHIPSDSGHPSASSSSIPSVKKEHHKKFSNPCPFHPNADHTAETCYSAKKLKLNSDHRSDKRAPYTSNRTHTDQFKKPVTCHACGQTGHYANDPKCPKKASGSNAPAALRSSTTTSTTTTTGPAAQAPSTTSTQNRTSASSSYNRTGKSVIINDAEPASRRSRDHDSTDESDSDSDDVDVKALSVLPSVTATMSDRTLPSTVLAASPSTVRVRHGDTWYPSKIDTCASTSLIDRALAQRLNIPIEPQPGMVLAINSVSARMGMTASRIPVEVFLQSPTKDYPSYELEYNFEVADLGQEAFILGQDAVPLLFQETKEVPSEFGTPAKYNGPMVLLSRNSQPLSVESTSIEKQTVIDAQATTLIDDLRQLHPDASQHDDDVLGTIPSDEQPDRTEVSTAPELESVYSMRRAQLLSDPAIVEALMVNEAITGFCILPDSVVHLDVDPSKMSKLYRKQYPLPQSAESYVTEQVEKWFKAGRIVKAPPGCQYNNPLTIAVKKDDQGNFAGIRVCLDVRALNAALLNNDRFLLPFIRGVLEMFGGNTIFGEFDLFEAYLQFPLHPDSQQYTAFTWNGQQYMFVGCPFGISLLPSWFQRVMAGIFGDLPFTCPYLDNLPFASKTWAEHRDHMLAIIHRCNQANLKIKVSSGLKVGHSQMRCLGHLLTGKGIGMHPEKLDKIRHWSLPSTGKELQSFLGFVTYIRHHVRHFAELTGPLESIKNNKMIEWNEELVAHFELTKQAVCAAPFLQFPDFNKPFHVATDASNTGVGGVLYQPDTPDGDITPFNIVAICSKKLSPSQRNYSAYKKELYGIVYCLRKFHTYIWGRKDVVLWTDHKPLTYMLESTDLSPALQQWLDVIMDYAFVVHHRPGYLNMIPDTLSRMYTSDAGSTTWGVPYECPLPTPLPTITVQAFDLHADSSSALAPVSMGEGSAPAAATSVLSNQPSTSSQVENDKSKRESTDLAMTMELRGKTIPSDLEQRRELVQKQHLFGHFGREAMFKGLFNQGYWWSGMRQDIENEIRDCDPCSRYVVVKAGYHPPTPIMAYGPWDHIQIDTSVHLPESPNGYTAMLVIIDVFTGFVILRPLRTNKAEIVARKLWRIFCMFGIPKIIQSDNGPEFANDVIRALVKLTGMDHRLISPYNPRADGKVERSIGTVMGIIKKLLHGSNQYWPMFVAFAQLSFNNKVASLTGASPFALMFGRKLNELKDYTQDIDRPTDVLVDANIDDPAELKKWQDHQEKIVSLVFPAITERVKLQKDHMIQQLKKHRRTLITPNAYPAGATVMLKDVLRQNKFEPKYVGPYTIVRRSQNGAYVLRDATGDIFDRHVPPDHLKLIDRQVKASRQRRQQKKKQQDVYAVEKILNHRGPPGKREYFVKWLNYPSAYNTWEPEKNFHDTACIATYWRENPESSGTIASAVPSQAPAAAVPASAPNGTIVGTTPSRS